MYVYVCCLSLVFSCSVSEIVIVEVVVVVVGNNCIVSCPPGLLRPRAFSLGALLDVSQITIMQLLAQIQKSVLRDSRAIVAFLLRDRGLGGGEPYAEKKSSTPKKCPLPSSLLVARLRAPPPPSSHHASVAFGQQLLAPDPLKFMRRLR